MLDPDLTQVTRRRVMAMILDGGLIAGAAAAAFFFTSETFDILGTDGDKVVLSAADQARVNELGSFGLARAQASDTSLRVFGQPAFAAGLVAALAALVLFLIVIPTLTRRSPGKMLTGLIVANEQGGSVSVVKHLVRTLAGFVDAVPFAIPGLLGFTLAGKNPLNQRLGDRLAKTVVIDSKRPLNLISPDDLINAKAPTPVATATTDAGAAAGAGPDDRLLGTTMAAEAIASLEGAENAPDAAEFALDNGFERAEDVLDDDLAVSPLSKIPPLPAQPTTEAVPLPADASQPKAVPLADAPTPGSQPVSFGEALQDLSSVDPSDLTTPVPLDANPLAQDSPPMIDLERVTETAPTAELAPDQIDPTAIWSDGTDRLPPPPSHRQRQITEPTADPTAGSPQPTTEPATSEANLSTGSDPFAVDTGAMKRGDGDAVPNDAAAASAAALDLPLPEAPLSDTPLPDTPLADSALAETPLLDNDGTSTGILGSDEAATEWEAPIARPAPVWTPGGGRPEDSFAPFEPTEADPSELEPGVPVWSDKYDAWLFWDEKGQRWLLHDTTANTWLPLG